MEAQPLDIHGQDLYSRWSYELVMEYQKSLLQFGNPTGSESTSKQVGTPLNQRAKNAILKRIEKYKDLKINEDTHQVILGSLLGDGCLTIGKWSPRFSESHCMEQKEYLKWKINFFLRNKIPLNENQVFYKKNGKRINYPMYSFATSSIPQFHYYHSLFYGNGRKEINWHILQQLESLGLAVWYLDDGHLYKRNGRSNEICISTYSFQKEQLELVKEWFKFRWDVNITVTHSDNIIYIKADSVSKFIDLIKFYVPKCMNYKININVKQKCICGKDVGIRKIKYCDECSKKYCHY